MRDDTGLSPSALLASGCDVGARRRGDRDVNFLAAMKELAASEPRFGTSPPAIDDLVAAVDVETSNRALRRTRAELEIELANLIERSLVLEPAGQPTGVTKVSCRQKVFNIASKSIRRPAVSPDGLIREDAYRCRQSGRTPRRCRQVTLTVSAKLGTRWSAVGSSSAMAPAKTCSRPRHGFRIPFALGPSFWRAGEKAGFRYRSYPREAVELPLSRAARVG